MPIQRQWAQLEISGRAIGGSSKIMRFDLITVMALKSKITDRSAAITATTMANWESEPSRQSVFPISKMLPSKPTRLLIIMLSVLATIGKRVASNAEESTA